MVNGWKNLGESDCTDLSILVSQSSKARILWLVQLVSFTYSCDWRWETDFASLGKSGAAETKTFGNCYTEFVIISKSKLSFIALWWSVAWEFDLIKGAENSIYWICFFIDRRIANGVFLFVFISVLRVLLAKALEMLIPFGTTFRNLF